jgi:serine/threonine protein kinase
MLEPGVQLGPYEVSEPLGRGGMGEVYLARDHRLGRELALKLLPRQATDDPAAVERFVREARAASALNHPNVITIYEIGEAEAGRYIAMELVRGETLRALTSAAPQSTDEVARLGGQIARALAVAHAAGIVHRDVKPENVMVRPDGYVKVLDFGIARLVATDAGRMTAAEAAPTVFGRAVGTLRYMSPEQACGEAVTAATDIFSLGLVLHELATGTHPFATASEVATVGAILTAAAPAPSASNPAVPAEFDALVARMLDKDPARRPAAAEVEMTLAEIARGPTAAVPGRKVTAPARHTVGRERERRLLRQALEEVESGRGLLVSVAGEPGIGKTTLVEEFLADVSGATRPLGGGGGRGSAPGWF